jgi:hypothetical protein
VFTRGWQPLPVRFDAYPLIKDGEDIGVVLLFADITERRRNEARIEFLAHHDPLTALPNRLLAEDRFEQARGTPPARGADGAAVPRSGRLQDHQRFPGPRHRRRDAEGAGQPAPPAVREADTVCRLGGTSSW